MGRFEKKEDGTYKDPQAARFADGCGSCPPLTKAEKEAATAAKKPKPRTADKKKA